MDVAGLPARATVSVLAVSAAAAVAVGGVAVVASMPWYTTYAAFSQGVVVSDAAAAVSLWGAGVLLSLQRPEDVRATLLVLAAVAWACVDWIGWQGGPDVVRTMGVVGQASLLPLMAHLVALTWPRWGSLLPAVRWLYAVTIGLVVARLTFANPLVDAACWQNCTANSVLVIDQPRLAAGLLRGSLVVTAVTGVAMVAAGVGLAAVGGSVARRQHLPVLLPAAALGAASAVQAALLLTGSVGSPVDRRFLVLHLAVAWALIGVGSGVGLVAVRSRRARRRIGELARNLALSSDELVASLLGRAIGDRTVQVAYRVGEPAGWVDAAGHRVADPDGSAPRGVVPVMRAGELIALISHDPDTAPDLDLASALGPAARLAIENESLQARQRARLHDLRDSQRRIVDAADAERARLERNLHDAAQVSVLGLIDTVHRAHRAAQHAGDAAASQMASAAAVEATATMEELRGLARGIHPALLDLDGLAPALQALADHAQIRVEVAIPQHERLPALVEHTVYVIAADAIREAAERGEDDLLLRAHMTGEWLEFVVDGTGQPPADSVRDRVGAMGGAVRGTGKALEVRLPCA